MRMKNIFNLENLDDVPQLIKDELTRDPFGEEIVQLFKLAERPLNIDEVFIAHYRMFSSVEAVGTTHRTTPNPKPKTKRQITLKLYNMSRDPNSVIKQCERGVYCLKESERNLFSVLK